MKQNANFTPKIKLSEVRRLSSCPESCVKIVEKKQMTLLLHPMYSMDLKKGVLLELNSMAMRYSKVIGGVVMGFESVKVLSPHGWLFDTHIYNHILIQAQFYIFSPSVGSVLQGVVQKTLNHHVGCLVHEVFIVSVPRPFEEEADGWCGTYVQEGDTVRVRVIYIDMEGHMPYIRGELDPEHIQELVERRKEEQQQKVEIKVSGFPNNSRIVFDDDSGISSNESLQNVDKKTDSLAEEKDEDIEEEESRKSKKKKKKKSEFSEYPEETETVGAKYRRQDQDNVDTSKESTKQKDCKLNESLNASTSEERHGCDTGEGARRKSKKRKRWDEDCEVGSGSMAPAQEEREEISPENIVRAKKKRKHDKPEPQGQAKRETDERSMLGNADTSVTEETKERKSKKRKRLEESYEETEDMTPKKKKKSKEENQYSDDRNSETNATAGERRMDETEIAPNLISSLKSSNKSKSVKEVSFSLPHEDEAPSPKVKQSPSPKKNKLLDSELLLDLPLPDFESTSSTPIKKSKKR